jgi:acyl-CoA synthetase (AMP-forming)/AMP-acid ligase II
MEKFGDVPVLEGYGATEASPVIAVNKPDDNRRGTVGGLLPGQEFRVEPVEGISGGGKLLVRGPNIMSGYLREDGGVDAPEGGWHDTGDVVSMSDDNWITIKGRVKRFAKIGGEMVSLTAAEDLASAVWPDGRHAVISMPDKKKGEKTRAGHRSPRRRGVGIGRARPDHRRAGIGGAAQDPEGAAGPRAGQRQDGLRRHTADGRSGREGRLN